MWDFAPYLPVASPAEAVTLEEGGTPLVGARGDWGCRLWLKDETRNPTGSHKDRALSVAITRGRELGFSACAIASAGSTGLSAAAYSARAGMRCALVVPRGTPDARLLPVAQYGARIFEAPGTFEDAIQFLTAVGAESPLYMTSTYRRGNPYQAEGTKTIGLELAQQMAAAGGADWIVVPTGGGGTVAAIWRAYQELQQSGALAALGGRLPRLATVQPAAYRALEIAMEQELDTMEALYALGISEEVPTVLAKLQHGVPPDAIYALAALRESGGAAVSVTDTDALAAQQRLASTEGIFAEPSAAAALAGIDWLLASGAIQAGDRVVALITGSGFREVHSMMEQVTVQRRPLDGKSFAAYLAGEA